MIFVSFPIGELKDNFSLSDLDKNIKIDASKEFHTLARK